MSLFVPPGFLGDSLGDDNAKITQFCRRLVGAVEHRLSSELDAVLRLDGGGLEAVVLVHCRRGEMSPYVHVKERARGGLSRCFWPWAAARADFPNATLTRAKFGFGLVLQSAPVRPHFAV